MDFGGGGGGVGDKALLYAPALRAWKPPPHLYIKYKRIKIEANLHLFLVRVFICVTFY